MGVGPTKSSILCEMHPDHRLYIPMSYASVSNLACLAICVDPILTCIAKAVDASAMLHRLPIILDLIFGECPPATLFNRCSFRVCPHFCVILSIIDPIDCIQFFTNLFVLLTLSNRLDLGM